MPEHPAPKPRPHPWSHAAPSSSSRVRRSAVQYAELQAVSNFSFLRGASHPDELVEQAAALGHRAIAIADRHTLAGIVRAHVAAKKVGLPLVVGSWVEVSCARGAWDDELAAQAHASAWDGAPVPRLSILLYPQSRRGYANLCRLLTLGKRRAPKGQCHLVLHDLLEHQEDLLGVVVPPAVLDQPFLEVVEGLRRAFDDDRLSIAASAPSGHDDAQRLAMLAALARHVRVPLVATNDVHYHVPQRRALQDVVTCIRHGTTLEAAGWRLLPHAERCLLDPRTMAERLRECFGAVERSVAIADRATAFSLDELRYEYPHEICPAGVTPIEHLRGLTRAGAAERWPGGVSEKVRRQLEHELVLVDELNYAPFFLTVHDLVVFARSRGILCQGRGAAANSAVCYCLGVTNVDPERIDMLFERFVSRERDEPPDIDIDFEHERREEVIQYVYGKYGRDRAALTGVVISYRGRSAVRDVGKALGLSIDCVDRISRNIDWWHDGVGKPEMLREIGLDPEDTTIQRLMELSRTILGFPRHLSQHVGGFVITRQPLCELVPIENAAMEDRTVIEWDKDDIDAMGMMKVDVLGLGMLTCIRKALELVNGRNRVVEETEGERERGGECGAEKRGERAKGRKGESGARPVERETRDSVVPRSIGVAVCNGYCGDGLPGHGEDAVGRRSAPDATRGRVDSIEYRRGSCEGGAGIRAVPPNCARVPQRALHSDRTLDSTGHDSVTRSSSDGGSDRALPAQPDSVTHALNESQSRIRSRPFALSPSRPSSASLPSALSLSSIPPEDPDVYDMICRADTLGVFQIESRAQMSMLPRLRPRCFYDLVIEVAIVRPGPIQGDMVHPYLRRRNGEEPVSYPDEKTRKVLAKTLGVPLFQEQAMALAIVAAGFTAGEADELRRAMAAWKRRGNQVVALRQRFLDGMIANGYPDDFAQRCFRQLEGFSEYGFPESHAASFAHLVYVSSWLKCHEPAAFAAALINAQPMGFYAPAQIVRDAKAHGVKVYGIDVNESGWDCRAGKGVPTPRRHWIRLGMRLVKGLREMDGRAVEQAVTEHGRFDSIEALWRASGASVAALRRLARADAFRSMDIDRQRALWIVRRLRDDAMPLFEQADGAEERAHEEERADVAVTLPAIPLPRQVVQDYHAMHLSLRAHPIAFLRRHLAKRGALRARELLDARACPSGRPVAVGGLVLVRQRPSTANGVVFMTLEDESGIANLFFAPQVYERFRAVARHAVALYARGPVERDGEVVHVMVNEVEALDRMLMGMSSGSRDFH